MVSSVDYSGNVLRGGRSSVLKVKKYTSRILVYFRDIGRNRARYRYEKDDIGSSHYNNMWSLAKKGKGLNSYIHRHRLKGKKE